MSEPKKQKKQKNQEKKVYPDNHMFSSAEEQIDYMYGDDPIMCQALKNCLEE